MDTLPGVPPALAHLLSAFSKPSASSAFGDPEKAKVRRPSVGTALRERGVLPGRNDFSVQFYVKTAVIFHRCEERQE